MRLIVPIFLCFGIIALLLLRVDNVYTAAQGIDSEEKLAWEMADRLIENLGGREIWARTKTLYVRERAFPMNFDGEVIAEFWRDMENPAYRSVVRGPGLYRETQWSQEGGWVIRNGVKTEMPEATLRTEILDWRQEPYVIYHKLALRDSSIRLKKVSDNQFAVYDRKDGDLLCWFFVNRSGELLKWGNLYNGEVSEHVYGPTRSMGEFKMPAWGAATNGSWRFEYEEVIALFGPLKLE